jgi:hypothetical protein
VIGREMSAASSTLLAGTVFQKIFAFDHRRFALDLISISAILI